MHTQAPSNNITSINTSITVWNGAFDFVFCLIGLRIISSLGALPLSTRAQWRGWHSVSFHERGIIIILCRAIINCKNIYVSTVHAHLIEIWFCHETNEESSSPDVIQLSFSHAL